MKRLGEEMRNSKFYSLTRLKCLKLEYFNTQRDNLTLFWLPRAQNASREASMYYTYKAAFKDDKDLVRRLKLVSRCGSRPSKDDARKTEVLTELETM